MSYPPTISFGRPLDWQDTDTAVLQRSQDSTFLTGVTETTKSMIGATTSYNFGLSSIASGIWFFRMAGYHGARPANLNWSPIAGIGDAVAGTITSANTASGYQFIATTGTLTADKGGYWTVSGGTNSDLFTVNATTGAWTMIATAATGAYSVQFTFTTYCGITTTQTLTNTLAANTPSAFTFTDVTNSALSTQYTSNTITIAGLVGGASVPVTVTGGTYSKNGGAYVSTATTCVNGDTFAVRQTSSGSNNVTTNTVLTAGATSDSFDVSTPVVLSTTTTWNPSDKSASVTLTNGNMTATGTNDGLWKGVRGTVSKSSGKRYFEFTSGGTGDSGIGGANGSKVLTTWPGNDANAFGYAPGGTIGNGIANGDSYTTGNVIGVAIDCDAGTFKVYKNGALEGSGPPGYVGGGSIAGPLFPYFGDFLGNSGTLNTGHSAWAYGPPAGYTAWDV